MREKGQNDMLDKRNSILWESYQANKHNYENETIQQFMLGLAICIDIDHFIEQHANFSGERELLAIKGMANSKNPKYIPYAAAYNNDIVMTMGLVRPKLEEILKENSADPTALILYAMTGMFGAEVDVDHILLTLIQYETMGIDVSGCKELWGHFAYTQELESNYDANQMDGKNIKPIAF